MVKGDFDDIMSVSNKFLDSLDTLDIPTYKDINEINKQVEIISNLTGLILNQQLNAKDLTRLEKLHTKISRKLSQKSKKIKGIKSAEMKMRKARDDVTGLRAALRTERRDVTRWEDPAKVRTSRSDPKQEEADFARLFKAIGDKKFVIIGETHPTEEVMPVLERLIESGKFKGIYIEALAQGDYNKEGDKLKPRHKVYDWNPAKYDEILDLAKAKGMEIHGIDVVPSKLIWTMPKEENREYNRNRTSSWGDYIHRTAGEGQYLILIGSAHLEYPKGTQYANAADTSHMWHGLPENNQSLPTQLVQLGVKREDILVLSSIISENNRTVLPYSELSEKDKKATERAPLTDFVYTRHIPYPDMEHPTIKIVAEAKRKGEEDKLTHQRE